MTLVTLTTMLTKMVTEMVTEMVTTMVLMRALLFDILVSIVIFQKWIRFAPRSKAEKGSIYDGNIMDTKIQPSTESLV